MLLIASGAKQELRIDRALAARSAGPTELWSVPDAAHTKALERHPGAYRSRVGAFLARALPGRT